MTTEKCLYNKNKTSKTAVTNKQKLQQIELVFGVKYAIDTLMKLPDSVPKNTYIASYQYPILVSFQAAKYHIKGELLLIYQQQLNNINAQINGGSWGAYLQPSLRGNGGAPLKHKFDELKEEGKISSKLTQHLWSDLWD
ncbi:9729_t:CDS:2, partial [Entrophospora sp. SA101]